MWEVFLQHTHTHTHTHTIYIYISAAAACRTASTDIPDPLSPLFPLVHRLWQVFWATSRILTQLLYVCSSWSSCFSSAICGGPLEYITYELVPASTAVSSVPGSSNLDSLILLATFLCSCRLASPPAVLLASKRCIHTAVLTRPLPGRNCVSFYRSGLISIRPIAYR